MTRWRAGNLPDRPGTGRFRDMTHHVTIPFIPFRSLNLGAVWEIMGVGGHGLALVVVLGQFQQHGGTSYEPPLRR